MELKLKELHIKNYKLFKDLEIPKLGQVNLITGKNNTGKTILLEALRIWASKGDSSVVNNIIWTREDWDKNSSRYLSIFSEKGVNNLEIVSNYDKIRFNIDFTGNIQNIIEVSVEWFESLNALVSSTKNVVWKRFEDKEYTGSKENPNEAVINVPADITFSNKFLWKKIILEKKKSKVIRILKVINSQINEVDILDDKVFIGLENVPNLIPLKNFGEGLNRLLTIAMALVSAEDNLLLIDEVDTGLHYSVLEKLWEIIFEFSGQLNTQVFVTTHSGDCVDAFSTVANQERFKGVGNYFRLQRKRNSEEVVPVFYKESELEIAVEQHIETR